jgi:hypothetical protein
VDIYPGAGNIYPGAGIGASIGVGIVDIAPDDIVAKTPTGLTH